MERRTFIKGAAFAGVAAAAAGLAGCAQQNTSSAPAEDTQGTASATTESITPSETIDCDICVVGAGISGLTACVQAAENGAKVVVIEAAGEAGGNGTGVEGSFAHGSPLQKEQGIEFEFSSLIEAEMSATQYRVDGRLWRDLYDKSGENIEWLIEQGVEFSGEVNDYGTGAGIVSMHWYKDGKGGVGFVPPMVAKAEELGVEFRYSMEAQHPVMTDGKVTGVLASDSDGNWLQVNAKAVILATGGFGADSEMVARIGYNPENIWYYGSPSNTGGGYHIAMEAGGKDFSYMAADNAHAYIRALPHEGPTDMPNCGMSMCGWYVWINQDAERFCREDCGAVNFCQQNPPRWNQKEWYFIFDQSIYEASCEMYGVTVEDGRKILEESVATNDGDCLYQSDTIEGLAEPFGLDADALVAEVEKYNGFCEAGFDDDWVKDKQWLMPLSQPPYYITKPETLFLMTIGGIATDRNGQVIDDDKNVIEGLYAVGVDGCMLYRNVYTIDAPGSCSGNAINMGRTAANHACENL